MPQGFNNSQKNKSLIIAIDGTASSGKGTLASKMASHFNLPYLNTGALYRLSALCIISKKIPIENFENNLSSLDLLELKTDSNLRELERELENKELFTENVGAVASVIARSKKLRKLLFVFQTSFVAKAKQDFGGCVLDGRDTTTVICPDADFKFFITAKVEVRAKRRQMQLGSNDYESILQALSSRDKSDFNRIEAPLKIADDAIVIDNSEISAAQCLQQALEIIESSSKGLNQK